MSITSEIERIQGAKNDIANSLTNKGANVPETARIDEFAPIIDELKTGGEYQTKSVTPSATEQVISPDVGYDALSKVTVAGDADLTSSNIKVGTTIFGVTGSYDGDASKVDDVYDYCATVGAVMPADRNFDNLLETVKSISQTTTYTVKFDTVGGTAIADQIIVHGHTIDANTETFRGDYEFIGWETADGEVYTKTTPIKKNVTLIAQWKSAVPVMMESTSSWLWGTSGNRISNTFYRSGCKSITFQMGGTPPETYAYKWDVSYENNGTILAYADNSGGYQSTYNLTIYSAGSIALPQNSAKMFDGFTQLETFTNLDKLKTENVTDMQYMFNGCQHVTSLDIGSWNTGLVTTLYYAFAGCYALETLDIGSWNTESLTKMHNAFYNCSALKSIDLNDWDTSNVTDMSYCFYGCKELTSVSVGNWDVSKVTNINYMFAKCEKLQSVPVSSWTPIKVVYARSVFEDCKTLRSIPCDNWNLTSLRATYLQSFAQGCTSLTSLSFKGTIGGSAFEIRYLCKGCTNLTSVDLSGYKGYIGEYQYIAGFGGCTSLQTIDIRQAYQLSSLDPEDLKEFLTDVPTSCTIYVKTQKEKTLFTKRFPNHNYVVVEQN